MKPWKWEPKFPGARAAREASIGYTMFSSQDPEEWTALLEDLGELYASAGREDLPEEDREWAEAHREEFRRWVTDSQRKGRGPRAYAGAAPSRRGTFNGEPAPPWPMLRDAVKSALLSFAERVENGPHEEREPALAKGARGAYRTFLWRTLCARDAEKEQREEALGAFERGWRRGYRAITRKTGEGRDSLGQSAYEGYLESSAGVFDGEVAGAWSTLSYSAMEAWQAFAERVEDALLGESEPVTAEVASREYWDDVWRESPPWESDPEQRHWLAAVRAVRAALAACAAPPGGSAG